MSIKISFNKNLSDKSVKNYVFFCDHDFKIYGFNKLQISEQSSLINKTINSNKSKDKKILLFNLNPDQRIILIKIKKALSSTDNEKKGANFYNFLKSNQIFHSTFFEENIKDVAAKNKLFINEFFHGLELKSYEFDKYKSKKKKETFNIIVKIKTKYFDQKNNKRFNSLLEGTNLTKDLVSEPGNVLHPDEYAKRITQLKKYGLKVTVYDEKKLKKLGMNALLGVGQGSIRGSYLVTIEWNGSKKIQNH